MRVYENNGIRIVKDDVIAGLRGLEDGSADLAIADPPYGAASAANWRLPENHALPGFGGAWKLTSEDWDQVAGLAGLQFTLLWLSELKRVVRPTGSIWIHGTYHNSGIANVACQMLGLEIINEVVWFKRNAFPNLSKRRLTASHETLLWVHTGGPRNRKYRFNYEEVKAASYSTDSLKQPGKQLRTVWDIPNNKAREELAAGSHPTQKPLRLTSRLFDIAGTPGGLAVVPFAGSGTELVAAHRYGMTAIGFEREPEHFEHACRRMDLEMTERLQLGG